MKITKWLYACLLPLALLCSGCSNNTSGTYHVSSIRGVDVHKTPSESGKVLGRLEHRKEVDVISIDGREGRWAKINYKGQEAYVTKRHIEKGNSTLLWIVVIGIVLLGAAAIDKYRKTNVWLDNFIKKITNKNN